MVIATALSGCASSTGKLTVHSQAVVDIELIGYRGLTETSIFKGEMAANAEHQILTPYHGLALLSFTGGQRYPVILGDEPFTLNISDPSQPPAFTDSIQNNYLYKSLSGGDPVPKQYDFANLMIQAKELLESTHSIKTTEELIAKKKEFHEFVGKHYEMLQYSDMVKRLIAQYFMMHEYVDYHIKGAPATDIKAQYQKAIINGVSSWLEILKTHIPEHEVLNYCVSLYYNRGMVTLASVIVDNFKESAYCPGEEKETFSFPDGMMITDGSTEKKLVDFNGDKLITFVSDECPVSMVEAVSKARKLSNQKVGVQLIVAPMEKLSRNHLSMSKMISGGNLLFINDEDWRKDNLARKIKLPLFVRIGGNSL